MDKDEVLKKLDALNKDRAWLATAAGYTEDTVMNKLGPSGQISGRMMDAFERAILEEEARGRVDTTKEDLSVWDLGTFTGMETARIMEGVKIGGYNKVEDLYHDAIMEYCDDLIAEESKITTLPKRTNVIAAAGAGVNAEIVDWNGEPTINVRITGLSMTPKFNDDDLVKFTHKSQARSPWMRKGLIYFVDYNGGYMVKVYNTRPAREDERDAEYLTASGSAGVLESLNPEFPPIDITQPLEWLAWYDE